MTKTISKKEVEKLIDDTISKTVNELLKQKHNKNLIIR